MHDGDHGYAFDGPGDVAEGEGLGVVSVPCLNIERAES